MYRKWNMAFTSRPDFEWGQDGLLRNNVWLFVNICARAQIIIMLIFSLSADMVSDLNIGINAINNEP